MQRFLSVGALCATLFAPIALNAAELSDQERAILISHYDKNGDGTLSDQEKQRALRRKDKDGDGLVDAEMVSRLQKQARKLIVTEWMGALDATTVTRRNSKQDQLKVSISKSVPVGGLHMAFVFLKWGDLQKKIGKGQGSKQAYSNWDGELVVAGAVPQKVDGIAFDDRKNKLPKVGSGADRLTEESRHKVAWEAGVVGATDGLLIRLVSPRPGMSGSITAGAHTIPFAISGIPAGTTLPNGHVVEE
jgi:hypothetical protein